MKKLFVFVIGPILIIFLGYLIVGSLSEPIRFGKEQKRREAVAIERLKDIRTLQAAYKSKFGVFTESLDTLINFYKEGHIMVVRQVGSMDDSLAVAQKRVYRDSISIPVRDTLLKRHGFVIDSIRFVPFSGGKSMVMQAQVRSVSGVPVPLFEACAPYDYLLRGMNRQLVVNLKADQEAKNRYKGLKVGSVDAPNNNAGNWE